MINGLYVLIGVIPYMIFKLFKEIKKNVIILQIDVN